MTLAQGGKSEQNVKTRYGTYMWQFNQQHIVLHISGKRLNGAVFLGETKVRAPHGYDLNKTSVYKVKL